MITLSWKLLYFYYTGLNSKLFIGVPTAIVNQLIYFNLTRLLEKIY
jgi:hypothetical protein